MALSPCGDGSGHSNKTRYRPTAGTPRHAVPPYGVLTPTAGGSSLLGLEMGLKGYRGQFGEVQASVCCLQLPFPPIESYMQALHIALMDFLMEGRLTLVFIGLIPVFNQFPVLVCVASMLIPVRVEVGSVVEGECGLAPVADWRSGLVFFHWSGQMGPVPGPG